MVNLKFKGVNTMDANSITLYDLGNACSNCASVSQVIKHLKLDELDEFKLKFIYNGCDRYDIILQFSNVTLTGRVICSARDLQYLTYMSVSDGWQLKIMR